MWLRALKILARSIVIGLILTFCQNMTTCIYANESHSLLVFYISIVTTTLTQLIFIFVWLDSRSGDQKPKNDVHHNCYYIWNCVVYSDYNNHHWCLFGNEKITSFSHSLPWTFLLICVMCMC